MFNIFKKKILRLIGIKKKKKKILVNPPKSFYIDIIMGNLVGEKYFEEKKQSKIGD